MVLRRRFRRRTRRSYTRRRPTFRARRRARRAYRPRRRYRRSRIIRPEWKKVDSYIAADSLDSQQWDQSQTDFTGGRYFIAPIPYSITQGVRIDQRIGNSLSRMIMKCRWSFSVINFGVSAGPTLVTNIYENYNIFLRVIIFQYKRGNGIDAPDEDGDPAGNELLYHPVNWPAFNVAGQRTWANWTGNYHNRIFGENQTATTTNSPVPLHLARLRVNIADEITVRYDKTYSFNSQGRSSINKRWKFRMSPYKWDENNVLGNDAVLYPQNAVRALFLVYDPWMGNTNVLGNGVAYRLDWTSSLRYTDS